MFHPALFSNTDILCTKIDSKEVELRGKELFAHRSAIVTKVMEDVKAQARAGKLEFTSWHLAALKEDVPSGLDFSLESLSVYFEQDAKGRVSLKRAKVVIIGEQEVCQLFPN